MFISNVYYKNRLCTGLLLAIPVVIFLKCKNCGNDARKEGGPLKLTDASQRAVPQMTNKITCIKPHDLFIKKHAYGFN